MRATLRVIVAVLLASSLAPVTAPSGAQTTRTLAVTPDTGLVDGDVVTLAGTGFTPSNTVFFCQGVFDEDPDQTDCGVPFASAPTNAAGEFTAQYTLRRFMSGIDCAQPAAGCAIAADDVLAVPGGPAVVTPITFAPLAPLTLTVTPDTGLLHGDSVTVEGRGYPPATTGRVCEAFQRDCDAVGTSPIEFTADDAGEFTLQLTVDRFVSRSDGESGTDCAAAASSCELLARTDQSLPSLTAPISFAPQPPVSMTVTPTTGLVAGDLVTVEGSAFVPAATGVVCQTIDSDDLRRSACDADAQPVAFTANAAGEFTLQLQVERFVTLSGGPQTLDCADLSSSCVVAAFSEAPPPIVPITFVPQPPASLAVTPDTGLVDGDVVTVVGSGFVPATSGSVCQAIDDGLFRSDDCDADAQPVAFTVNDAGEFTVQLTVQRLVTPSESSITTDCAHPSSGCLLATVASEALPAFAPLGFTAQPALPAIVGTVTGPDGSPLTGTDVWAYIPTDPWVGSLRTTTGADGSYAFEGAEAGTLYRVLFHRPDGSMLASEWFDNKPSRRSANGIIFPTGRIVTADAQLAEGGAISGTVTDPDGDPVAGAAVSVFGGIDTWVGSYVTSTAPDGTYLVPNILSTEVRPFRVRFSPPTGSGLAPEWWNDKSQRRVADRVWVTPGQTVTGIDAQLAAGGLISGTVTDPDGDPVAGAAVSVFGVFDVWFGSYVTSTAPDGTYLVPNILPTGGPFRVRFGPPTGSGLAPEWWNDKPQRLVADPVSVSSGQTVTGIDAQLAPGA